MEVLVDIEECLLGDFDRAARIQNITRNAAIRSAITDWLSQARRDAVVRELFESGVRVVRDGGGHVEDILKRLGKVEADVSELKSEVSAILATIPYLATKADVRSAVAEVLDKCGSLMSGIAANRVR